MQSPTHCEVLFNPLVDQVGVGVWPKYPTSYYHTVDVADTILGPDVAISSSPIYEGAHYYRGHSLNVHSLNGVVYQIYFLVGDHTFVRCVEPSVCLKPTDSSPLLRLTMVSNIR